MWKSGTLILGVLLFLCTVPVNGQWGYLPQYLNDLRDVNESSPADTEALVYDNASSMWVAGAAQPSNTLFTSVWDDLRAPATVILTGPGSGNAADRSTDGTLLFATNQDEEVFVIFQLPHGYKYGTNLVPHVHWAKSTSAGGDVCWRVDWECKDIGETFTNSPATLSLAYLVDDADTAFLHAYAEYDGGFDPDSDNVSAICKFRIWRDVSGDGASCADDYAADAILYEFDLHYQSDTLGSSQEGVK